MTRVSQRLAGRKCLYAELVPEGREHERDPDEVNAAESTNLEALYPLARYADRSPEFRLTEAGLHTQLPRFPAEAAPQEVSLLDPDSSDACA